MKADEENLWVLIKNVYHFNVPRYQRPYSWGEKECSELWEDVLQAGRGESAAKHFIGCIICVKDGKDQIHQPLLIIDGQQRITTMMLLLEAVARSIEQQGKDFGGISAASLRRLIRNEDDAGNTKYKIHLSGDDQQHFENLIQNDPDSASKESTILKNFNFFAGKIKELEGDDVAKFYEGLINLQVVSIMLHNDDDDPQYVFESMNSKGKDLGAADLIRNYMLMKLSPREQEKLHEEYWRPIEKNLNVSGYDWLEAFMRDYLVAQKAAGVGQKSTKRIYNEFRRFHKAGKLLVKARLLDMKTHSEYYAQLVSPEKEGSPKLVYALKNWQDLNKEGPTPLMLVLYAGFKNNRFDEDEFVDIIRLIESYVFRRWVLGMPTNVRNDVFNDLISKLNNQQDEFGHDGYFASVEKHFCELGENGPKRFPGDKEFEEHLCEIDIYSKGKSSRHRYVLSKLENYGHEMERVDPDSLTVEHIMPQNLTSEWEEAIGWGDENDKMHKKYVHRLGNLTLTGYNSTLSRKPFAEKRDCEGGFGDSPLWLNQGLANLLVWNIKKIEKRGKTLARRALKVWALPYC